MFCNGEATASAFALELPTPPGAQGIMPPTRKLKPKPKSK